MKCAEDLIEWCKKNHASLKIGGVWAVPRSCMVFKKTVEGYELLTVMPYLPEMSQAFSDGKDVPASPSDLLKHQREDFEVHRACHELAGLKITDPMGLLQ